MLRRETGDSEIKSFIRLAARSAGLWHQAASTMRTRLVIAWALVAIGFGLAAGRASAAEDERAATAVLYRNKLIGLNEKGRFHVWVLEDGSFDEDTASKLSRESITHLASDGDNLWAGEKSTLHSWSPAERSWKKVSEFKGDGEELVAIVGVGGSPLLIFPTMVKDVVEGRAYKVPPLKGQIRTNALRILAIHATRSMLWIGTGYGEWGGHLVGLDPKTGDWVQYSDELHYVTGITQAAPDEVIVSWSMSHFGANTMIRVHRQDGTPKLSFPELESKYYQKIAYSPFDKILYGVENTDVVSIKEGKPSNIAELKGQLFEREPHAIGVSPGVSALLPVAHSTLFVVPNHGLPWRLNDGKLTRLRVP
jgi:hypothetical protein